MKAGCLELSVTDTPLAAGRRRTTRLRAIAEAEAASRIAPAEATPHDGRAGVPAVEIFHESADLPPLTEETPLDGHVLCQLGSTPVADHLMSGDLIQLVHDGAGYSRTEKVARLADCPLAVERLKVCCSGRDPSTNCGRCEKCLRTMLNFLAAGRDVPSSLRGKPTVWRILRMRVENAPLFQASVGLDETPGRLDSRPMAPQS